METDIPTTINPKGTCLDDPQRDYGFDSSACVVSTGPVADRQDKGLMVYLGSKGADNRHQRLEMSDSPDAFPGGCSRWKHRMRGQPCFADGHGADGGLSGDNVHKNRSEDFVHCDRYAVGRRHGR